MLVAIDLLAESSAENLTDDDRFACIDFRIDAGVHTVAFQAEGGGELRVLEPQPAPGDGPSHA